MPIPGGASVPQPAQGIGAPSGPSATGSDRPFGIGESSSPVDSAPSMRTWNTLWPAVIRSPEPSLARSTRFSFTNVPLVLPRSRSSQRGGLISIKKWSRESAESSGIGQ